MIRSTLAGMAAIFVAAACAPVVHAAPLTMPFDFSRHAIGLTVTVRGQPLYVLLDTGVDPSVIDARRAKALHLPSQHGKGGNGEGEGEGNVRVYPATIRGLHVGGRAYGDVEALAMDMGNLSKTYGRPLDGVLGYSFLKGRTVVVDYAAAKLTILDGTKDIAAWTRTCTKRHVVPLKLDPEQNIPILDGFRFGKAAASISLDTGSNRGISLYPSALALPGLKQALVHAGKVQGAGARGSFSSDAVTLDLPVGIGPFALPTGGEGVVMGKQSNDRVVANVGNRLFADLGARLVLDYAGGTVGLYGDCGGR